MVSARSASAIPMLAPMATARSRSWSGLEERIEDAERDPSGLVGRVEVVDQDRELVAAETRDRVEIAQLLLEAVGDGDQECVTGEVAETVVHVLESVEVDHHDRDESAAARPPAQGVREPVVEQRPVRQAGERDRASPGGESRRPPGCARSTTTGFRRLPRRIPRRRVWPGSRYRPRYARTVAAGRRWGLGDAAARSRRPGPCPPRCPSIDDAAPSAAMASSELTIRHSAVRTMRLITHVADSTTTSSDVSRKTSRPNSAIAS